MAQKTTVRLVDDLDGAELGEDRGETVTFALDGTTYEIDLSRENADALRGLIYDYAAKGRKVSSGRRAARTSVVDGPPPAEVRAWAQDNGYNLPDRGRIPAQVREAYDRAH